MAQCAEDNPLANHKITEKLELCKSLIHEFHSKKHAQYAWPFLIAVDPVKLNIPDYFDIIKKPMDLGIVKAKLENKEYKNIMEFAEDVRLIFSNCYKYNGPETDIIPMAKKLEAAFESRFTHILSGEPNAMGDAGKDNDERDESSESSSNDDESENDDLQIKKRKLFHQDTSAPPSLATDAVLVRSEAMPEGSETVRGYDFNNGLDYHELLKSYKRSGFQALNFGKAVEEINKMIDCKLQPIPEDKVRTVDLSSRGRPQTNCTIFLAYTSNLISSGVREIIRYLVQHNMVDCIVTTAGGIEEDFIKCMASTYLGDFTLKGRELREKGINRIGNLLVPNDNYCKFEDWLMPILNQMVKEQKEQNILWTPSKMIDRLGREINHPDSVYYWAHKNNIPVFCPAITDGSLGDIIYFHSYKNPGLVLDLVQDIRGINSIAAQAVNSGMIIVGGGVVKHHTANANLMRNGADYCVYLNTASEFDGSDSGARPDEAVSWGKIKKDATPVKIYGEATLVLPLLVAETFARREKDFKASPDNG